MPASRGRRRSSRWTGRPATPSSSFGPARSASSTAAIPATGCCSKPGAERRTAAFATQNQLLTVATPENVPVKFRDLLLRPEGATDWAVYYPPVLLGTGVADPAVREAAALLEGGDPAGAEGLWRRRGPTGGPKRRPWRSGRSRPCR